MPYGPSMYIGIDECGGPGVDIQMSGDHLYAIFARECFDVILCIEVLEHAANWSQLINQMKYVLRPGGVIFITCRAPGFPYHNQPNDYWRFTIDDITRAFADLQIIYLQHDPGALGVLAKFYRPETVDLSQIEPVRIYEDSDSSTL